MWVELGGVMWVRLGLVRVRVRLGYVGWVRWGYVGVGVYLYL